ncbi:MAG TPA: ABC transporter ATP-binding protein [Candidatus Binatia bacterium]|jgi:lipoprotein-releasing system ATP-binding protein|nr:ABC transporter ATP-binding protein [Candidatus Binatia bacterium]
MLLELTRVSKAYASPDGGPAVEVLKDVDLQLAAGEAVAIIGPSGSGKSTLLNIMGALDLPTDGQVRLDGRDLRSLNEAELATMRNRSIGFIFQLHHLLPQCTVLENVLIPTLTAPAKLHTAATLERAERLLDWVGLKQRHSHRPGQLSGGERQRVAVVRALINRPKLLLADEPTGSLDRAAAMKLGELLVELNTREGVALVLVTHSQELARRLPRVLELDGGVLR